MRDKSFKNSHLKELYYLSFSISMKFQVSVGFCVGPSLILVTTSAYFDHRNVHFSGHIDVLIRHAVPLLIHQDLLYPGAGLAWSSRPRLTGVMFSFLS